MCFARYLAKQAVKAQLQAAGMKPAHTDARIIAAKANAYLDRYRDELLAQATMTIDSVPSLRKMAEAEARSRCSNIRTNGQARKPWPAAVSVVHNSCPER